jgi:hypothetical protein
MPSCRVNLSKSRPLTSSNEIVRETRNTTMASSQAALIAIVLLGAPKVLVEHVEIKVFANDRTSSLAELTVETRLPVNDQVSSFEEVELLRDVDCIVDVDVLVGVEDRELDRGRKKLERRTESGLPEDVEDRHVASE